MPKRWTVLISSPGPMNSSALTAGMFRDCASAWRTRTNGDVDLAIDLRIVEIEAAEHRQHLAALRLQRHQRGVAGVALADGLDLLAGRAVSGLLEVQIQ